MNGHAKKDALKPDAMNVQPSFGKKDAVKPDVTKIHASRGKYVKFSHDRKITLAHSMGNRVLKVIIMKQAKRPLDSTVKQLRTISVRLGRAMRNV